MAGIHFFTLKPAVGTEETGMAYPAVESDEEYDFSGLNSVYKLDSDFFPDFIPEIRFKLAEGAKLCDIMGQSTISACGLLVSQYVRNVFEQFAIIPHEYYKAEIRDTQTSYYWIHFVWQDGINHLDFKNSKFQINEFGVNLGDIEIGSKEELLEKQGALGFMKMIYNYKSVLTNISFDLFIHPLNKTIYVSEKLANAMINKSLKGVDLTETTVLSVR